MDGRRTEYMGDYRVVGTIKTGQNSKVYTVIHDDTKKRYALKILLSDFSQNREHLALMRHEFEVAKGLDHPRVIKLFDFHSGRHHSFLLMELFPYPNMKDILLQGIDRILTKLPQVIEQAAEGLAYFNDQGWIHRDIKPDNFLVNDEGEVKLIDFALAERPKKGLAKLFGGKTKKIQGTRSYMSPEQIRGKPLDARADLYGLGCTLYHLLAGSPPYTGISSNELLNKHLSAGVPALEAQNRAITPEFGALVRSMMAKRPEERPDNAHKFLQEFRAIRLFKPLAGAHDATRKKSTT